MYNAFINPIALSWLWIPLLGKKLLWVERQTDWHRDNIDHIGGFSQNKSFIMGGRLKLKLKNIYDWDPY